MAIGADRNSQSNDGSYVVRQQELDYKKHAAGSMTRTKVPKIVHRSQTGRILHRWHTSYVLLFFVLVLTGSFLLFVGQQAADAADQVTDSSLELSGIYYGEAPTQAAVIESPKDNGSVNSSVITVSGTCQPGYIVEVYRDGAVAGTIICSTTGTFSLDITVVPGQSSLVARTKNAANVYGPDSNTVRVTYEKPASNQAADEKATAALPLLIYTKPVQSGYEPGEAVLLEYEIDGGVPVYALSINWGDGTQNTIKPHSSVGDFSEEHRYADAGQYTLTLIVRDSAGNIAQIQTIAIINGEPENPTSILSPISSQDCATQNLSGTASIACIVIRNVNAIWPAFIIAILMTFSFWLGEKVVFARMKRTQQTT